MLPAPLLGPVASIYRRLEGPVTQRARRLRRRWFVVRLQVLAKAKGADLTLDIAQSVRVDKGVKVAVAPGSTLVVRMGEGCSLSEGVVLFLVGGAIVFGPDVQLRRGTTIMLSGGHLEMEGGNILSFGCVVHCGDRITLQRWSGCGEYCSIVDSNHFYTEPDVLISTNTSTAPVSIGYNTFLAPRSSVNRGVTVGDHSIVAPGTVVIKDVPDGVMVSGVPVSVTRPLDLPWKRDEAQRSDPA